MILNWRIAFSKALFEKMPLKRLAPLFEKELGLFDDEWQIKNDRLIFDPCSLCFVPWISALRIVAYDIIVSYDSNKEELHFKFRLFKLYIYSLIFAVIPALGGGIEFGTLAFVMCFGIFFLLFFIELIFRKASIRDALQAIVNAD